MKNKPILFAILLTISFLASCVGPKQTNLLQDIDKNYSRDDITPLDYKIIAGDQLAVNIYTLDETMKELFSPFMHVENYRNPAEEVSLGGREMSPYNVLTVSSNGTIKIPYIGHIYVLNMTTLEANKAIAEKFRDFSSNVKVEVNLRNRYFFVLGELGAKPVQMPHLRMTIYQALAQAGNINTFGDRRKVKILRQTVNGTEIKTFDIRSKDIVNSDYYYIQPNDVIYVPQLQRKFYGGSTSFTGMFGLTISLIGTVFGVWWAIDEIK